MLKKKELDENSSNNTAKNTAASQLALNYLKAPAAKLEIDTIADEIAAQFNGQVAKAPIKSQERALEKIMSDYGGNANRIKDLVRNTIIVDHNDIEATVSALRARNFNVKIIDGAADPLGYSGINSTIKTQAGITGEIQVNTPAMIYAKEPAAIAKLLLGAKQYQSIAAGTKITGGQGHVYYEQWRKLPLSDPMKDTIKEKSKTYYKTIRNATNGD